MRIRATGPERALGRDRVPHELERARVDQHAAVEPGEAGRARDGRAGDPRSLRDQRLAGRDARRSPGGLVDGQRGADSAERVVLVRPAGAEDGRSPSGPKTSRSPPCAGTVALAAASSRSRRQHAHRCGMGRDAQLAAGHRQRRHRGVGGSRPVPAGPWPVTGARLGCRHGVGQRVRVPADHGHAGRRRLCHQRPQDLRHELRHRRLGDRVPEDPRRRRLVALGHGHRAAGRQRHGRARQLGCDGYARFGKSRHRVHRLLRARRDGVPRRARRRLRHRRMAGDRRHQLRARRGIPRYRRGRAAAHRRSSEDTAEAAVRPRARGTAGDAVPDRRDRRLAHRGAGRAQPHRPDDRRTHRASGQRAHARRHPRPHAPVAVHEAHRESSGGGRRRSRPGVEWRCGLPVEQRALAVVSRRAGRAVHATALTQRSVRVHRTGRARSRTRRRDSLTAHAFEARAVGRRQPDASALGARDVRGRRSRLSRARQSECDALLFGGLRDIGQDNDRVMRLREQRKECRMSAGLSVVPDDCLVGVRYRVDDPEHSGCPLRPIGLDSFERDESGAPVRSRRAMTSRDGSCRRSC